MLAFASGVCVASDVCECVSFAQHSSRAGRNVLLRWLHKHPEKAVLWLQVSRYLMQNESEQQSGAAATCARAATLHCQVNVVSWMSYSRKLKQTRGGWLDWRQRDDYVQGPFKVQGRALTSEFCVIEAEVETAS